MVDKLLGGLSYVVMLAAWLIGRSVLFKKREKNTLSMHVCLLLVTHCCVVVFLYIALFVQTLHGFPEGFVAGTRQSIEIFYISCHSIVTTLFLSCLNFHM